ncbi:MAG TPA: hypothetical protein VKD22_06155 [Ramlibacter sp.]|jgi:hypothetical protein|nr:hypothetical protein [Ramlibacter sp.]
MTTTVCVHFLMRTVQEVERERNVNYRQLLDTENALDRLWLWLQQLGFAWGQSGMRFKHVEVSFSKEDLETWRQLPEVAPFAGRIHYHAGGNSPGGRVSVSVQATERQSESLILVREFRNAFYTTLRLAVPRTAAQVMFQFALENACLPAEPPTWVFFSPTPPTGRTWYCLNLVVTTLQAGGVMRGFNSSALTTDDLYDKLRRYHRVEFDDA